MQYPTTKACRNDLMQSWKDKAALRHCPNAVSGSTNGVIIFSFGNLFSLKHRHSTTIDEQRNRQRWQSNIP